MTGKLRLGVLFGGRSGEHEVSLMSARSVLSVLGRQNMRLPKSASPTPGTWMTGENVWKLWNARIQHLLPVVLLPQPGKQLLYQIISRNGEKILTPYGELDVNFPVLHGTFRRRWHCAEAYGCHGNCMWVQVCLVLHWAWTRGFSGM